jgi:hypothetical protein
VAVAVTLRGINEIAAEVERLVQRADGFIIVLLSPTRAADGPCTKTNFGNPPAQSPKFPVFHFGFPFTILNFYLLTVWTSASSIIAWMVSSAFPATLPWLFGLKVQ